jgi:dipeptidyl aminopeptidase/acylaminoacyl peptidase
MNRDDRKKVGKLVKELDDSDPYKERFTAMLKEIGVGEPLDIKEGIYEFNHNGMRYFVYMPKDATTNMPLLLWLHGDNCREEWAKNSHIPKTAEEAGYSIIQVNPYVGRGMGTNPKGWYESGLLPTVKEIVDEVCERYKCDTSNINIGGHSRGAIGTWMMVSRYPNFFHAAAPVSCCSFYGMNAESFKGMKVWATRGSNAGKGDDNDNIYGGCMQSDVNAVKKYAKEVRYIIQPNTTHGDATNELSMSKEFVEFMFED